MWDLAKNKTAGISRILMALENKYDGCLILCPEILIWLTVTVFCIILCNWISITDNLSNDMFATLYGVIWGDAWGILGYLYHLNIQQTHIVQRRRISETTRNFSLPSTFMNAVLSKHCMNSGLLLIVTIEFGQHHNLFMTEKRNFATNCWKVFEGFNSRRMDSS